LKRLTDVAASVRKFIGVGNVQLVDGAVTYKGEVLDNSITNRILDLMNAGLPFEPMVKFLNNLMQNPSMQSVNELYPFLEKGDLPITEDGHFLAFKNVRADYFDIHSGTKRNMVGDKPEMDRNQVDDNRDRTCSQGLHFCSESYLPRFAHSQGGHTMVVKVNPRDVVSVPSDYNDAKARACTYEVVAELVGKPSDLTDRKVVSDFDPKPSADDVAYAQGAKDAANGVWNPPAIENVQAYVRGGTDYMLSKEDEVPCDCALCTGVADKNPDNKYNVRDKKGRFVRKS
jgi:hypothetical protein